MKKIFLVLTAALLTLSIFAQQGTIKGVIKDAETGETLIGANVLIKAGVGTVTDFNGEFTLQADPGEYNLTISYVGYEATKRKVKVIAGKTVTINVSLKTITLNEVQVVADVARSRETPVAFTNVLPAKIEEELGAQDIPMVLNSTPGVYATQQGGGDGDARITIRGFNQRNVAVMLDGIPVNDMENGWVYWSNWFGLDVVTRSIQVQRGLGASKLALPSVGGTMNIITKGIENKRNINIKQEVNSDGKLRTSLGYTSGKLKNGWGLTLAGSYKKGNGYVDETWVEGFFYYAKVDKRIGKHILSASVMGAPQEHGQRSYKRAIATYDRDFAEKNGVDTLPGIVDKGLKYNQQWGYIDRWEIDESTGDTIHHAGEKLHYKVNSYHKPMFSVRDFWNVTDKLYISNIAYLSIGHGGGTGTKTSLKDTDLNSEGQIDWQPFYDANRRTTGFITAIDAQYSLTETKSSQYIVTNMNDHFWYGLLSSANYKMSNALTFSGGVDLRSYKGSHYRVVTDLLGGDYCVDNYNVNQDTAVKKVGDKIYFYDDAWVKWGGLFGQLEYKTGNLSSFINLSGARTGFLKEDYFKDPNDPVRKSGWLWKTSYTVKGGVNYNLSERSNVFVNLGYLSKTRASKYLYDGYDAKFREKTDNELVKALELGYTYSHSVFSANINAYYTKWEDKPMNDIYTKVDGEDAVGQIPGIDQLHKGIEMDFIYKITHNLNFQGIVSLGDWKYDSKVNGVILRDRNNRDVELGTMDFDAKGVHVGDAAQTQFGGSVRYEPIKGLYLNMKYSYNDRYYADMEPSSLTGGPNAVDENGDPLDSWKIPSYDLVDFNAGYYFKVDKFKFNLRLSVFNVLDKEYISDARNNDAYIYSTALNTFDANAASVFMGLGRRYNVSLKVSF